MEKEKTERTYERKAAVHNGVLRLVFVSLAVILEVGFLLLFLLTSASRYSELAAVVSRALAFFLCLGIYSQYKTSAMKTPWIFFIMMAPIIGIVLYLSVGLSGATRRMRRRYQEMDDRLFPLLSEEDGCLEALQKKDRSIANIFHYVKEEARFPVYRNEGLTYYADTVDALEAMKAAMRRAKKFIFMEYFAIEDAEVWAQIQEILTERIAHGVEVRVFYDDVGSISFITKDFAARLRKRGINCRIFNPMSLFWNLFLNNRDHRKMTIVDGEVAFTGGFNIANEYFNMTHPYGHWKDAGIRMEGNAVDSMTIMFLAMWNAVRSDDENDTDVRKYLRHAPADAATDLRDIPKITAAPMPEASDHTGFVQPYGDSPMDKKQIGEDVYISLIERAEQYIYIMTPYLIITDEMNHALCLAAKRGVDVRIVTPGIPDKKMIYSLTRSYYSRLAQNGVRIYEYTPGFSHAKLFVSDDRVATCGTINLDYRSLYHHLENGCLFAFCPTVMDVRRDFAQTLPQCKEVTWTYGGDRPAPMRFRQLVLRLVAPLL